MNPVLNAFSICWWTSSSSCRHVGIANFIDRFVTGCVAFYYRTTAVPTMPTAVSSIVLLWILVQLMCIQTVYGTEVSVRFESVKDTTLSLTQTLSQSTSETHCLDTCVRTDFCSSVSFNKITLECQLSVVTHNLRGVLTQQEPSFNTYFKTGISVFDII